MLFQICVFVEMVKLFEYKHLKIISHYCYHMNTSFALSYYKCIFINGILEPISGDVINVVTLSTWQYAANTKQTKSQQNKTE
jgi:hypothetical protein